MSDSSRDVARSRPAAWSSLIRADSSPGAQLNATCVNRDRALGDTAMPAQTSGKGRVRDWFGPKARDVRRGGSPLPVNALHVGGPGVSVLIDACDPARYPGAGQAGTVGACLARAEIAPPGMTHVIITHGHHDHFCGLIALSVGTTFPEARHILSPLDWSDGSLTGEAQKADGSNADPAALEHLFRLGLLDLEEMTVPLPPEVTLIDSPGETPGHRVVRIASGGEVLYFLADLFHVMAEIDDPNLCLIWADAPALRASRSPIIATIRRERARFLQPPAGRLFLIRVPKSILTIQTRGPNILLIMADQMTPPIRQTRLHLHTRPTDAGQRLACRRLLWRQRDDNKVNHLGVW